MIGSMRKKKGSVGVWIILGLLCIGLVGFGIGGIGGLVTRSIGSVGDTEIPVSTYASTLSATQQQIIQQTGRRVTFQEFQLLGIFDNVVNDAVRATALDDVNGTLSISIGDEALARAITANPQFRGIDGSFNQTSYAFFLRQNGLSAQEYEDLLRRGTARLLLERAILSGIEAPEAAYEPIVTYAMETRDIAWIELNEENLETPVPEIDDQMAEDFYTENTDLFQSLETKNITYAWLTPDMLDDVEISEDALRADYQTKIARFSLPERRAMERLTFLDQEAADEAMARITSGQASFPDLVEERGLALGDIDLGIVERDAISAEAAEVIFGDIEPGVFGPYETPIGYALFRVTARLDAQVIPFEDARDELIEDLSFAARSEVLNTVIPEVDDLLAAGATLEEVGEETALSVGELGYTAISQDGIAAYSEFREAASVAEAGDFPEVVTLSDGGVFALRVNEIVPSGTRPFEEVTEQARDFARAAAVQEALTDQAAMLQSRIEGGESIFALGLSSSAIADIPRGAPTSDFDRFAVSQIFDIPAGGLTTVPSGEGLALVQVEAVNPPNFDTQDVADVIVGFRGQLTQAIASDLLVAFADGVAEEAGIALDFPVIEQINMQAFGMSVGVGHSQ